MEWTLGAGVTPAAHRAGDLICLPGIFLWAASRHHQNPERARNRRWSRMRILRGRRGRQDQIRRRQIDRPVTMIDRHRPRANLSLYRLRQLEFIRRYFTNDRQSSVAAAREHESLIECGRVHIRADWEIGHDLSVV